MEPSATPVRYESSAEELSSPPSGLSETGSPSRRAKREGEDLVATEEHRRKPAQRRKVEHVETPPPFEKYETVPSGGNGPPKRYGLLDGQWIQLTASGMPRKKPGRKPGTFVKPKEKKDGDDGSTDQQAAKPRRSRKSQDPSDARKRKTDASAEAVHLTPTAALKNSASTKTAVDGNIHGSDTKGSHPPQTRFPLNSNSPSYHNSPVQPFSNLSAESQRSPAAPKRESGFPASMKSILNDDTPTYPSPTKSSTIPVRTSGQSYDPIRGNYDPVREIYSTSGSPRASHQHSANRSPSIASLIEPAALRAPTPSKPITAAQSSITTTPRYPSPVSYAATTAPTPAKKSPAEPVREVKSASEKKQEKTPAPAPARPVIRESQFTTIADGPVRKTVDKGKNTSANTPKTDIGDEVPAAESENRSILDFGRVKPGDEQQAPTIVLHVPIRVGETNKYINFTRLAEERYGWDALHPRMAADRDRKARIAAAAATLEKESARESGDEMSLDLSDVEGSNPDNGGTSNPEAALKPKKKRVFKEDQYDVDDDFVDDSDMLWEAKAAASRDGFFVYSGPLVPEEEEKPATGRETTSRRGRGGKGSRGGRGGAARGANGTGRGGGPGSRGGSAARKPRVTKSEKAQREREKAERESLALAEKADSGNGYLNVPSTPALKVSE